MSAITFLKTFSSLSTSNQPNLVILANKVTSAWTTKFANLGLVAR